MDSGENLEPLGSPLNFAQKSQPWPDIFLAMEGRTWGWRWRAFGSSPRSRECWFLL